MIWSPTQQERGTSLKIEAGEPYSNHNQQKLFLWTAQLNLNLDSREVMQSLQLIHADLRNSENIIC